MRIAVHVLLYLQHGALLLHLHAEHDVQVLGLGGCGLVIFAAHVELRLVCVLHIVAGMSRVGGHVDTPLHKAAVKLA